MLLYRRGALAILACLFAAAVGLDRTLSAATSRDTAFIGYSERSRPTAGAYGASTNCMDEDANCDDWARNGECDRNPKYMKVSCRRSCNACGTDERLPHSCADCTYLKLVTTHGTVSVLMRSDWSPKTVAAVLLAVGEASRPPGALAPCRGCELYRSEKVPPAGAIDNFGGPGPPYALLQGRIPGLKHTEQEATPLVERGMVCLIGNGPDFFIAVGPHHEWGQAHTVWGEVMDMAVVDLIVDTLPTKSQTWGQTHVTVLEHPIAFAAQPAGTA